MAPYLTNYHVSKEMLTLLKKGDKETFAQFYDNFSVSIYGIILKIVKDEKIAEDVLQGVFVRVFSEIKDYKPDDQTIFIWVYKIAKGMALNSIDSRLKNRVSELVEVNKTFSQPFLELIYFRGFTIDEVVKELSIPKETVKKKLREELKQFILNREKNG